MPPSPDLGEQLQELQMIHSTLLPGEIMFFLDDHEMWMSALVDVGDPPSALAQTIPSFRIGLEGYKALWFEVVWDKTYSPTTAGVDGVVVYVKGESLNRSEQERVQGEVKGGIEEVGAGGEE
jgi:hypothetical protein